MNSKRFFTLLLAAALCLALTAPAGAAASSKYQDDWVYITIDPGHGGVDSGCVATYDGKQYTERDICMQIGLYLKEELESYRHVKVFLTRTPDTPSSQLVSGEVKSRMDYAVQECSDFLISLHLNDVGDGAAMQSGALALVSRGNYRPEIAAAGVAVAQVTLAELEKLGVENRGLLYRDSEGGTRYPNGKIADYYGIVRYGILANIPSTLIEHCFLRSEHDFRALLSSEEKLRAVAKADAAGLVEYFGLVKKEAPTLLQGAPAEEAPLRLRDLPDHWAAASVSTAVSKGWVTGYPDRTFRPDATLTRADFVTLLSRMSGEDLSEYTVSAFPDVADGEYYTASVAWATDAGILTGFPDGTFKPTQNVTREQMAHIMTLYLQHAGLDTALTEDGVNAVDSRIADLKDIGDWALDDVRFCYAVGLLNGRGNGFVPAGTATRAEAATVLLRLADYIAANAEPDLPDELDPADEQEPSDETEPTDDQTTDDTPATALTAPVYTASQMPNEAAD